MLHPLGLPTALQLDRTLVMGVVNVTPDSFSDGGQFLSPAAAIAQGRALALAGADILDIGGESTRPGAARVSVDEELSRVIPVIEALAADGHHISVDTMRGAVAAEAVRAGACIVNDVSGGLGESDMLPTVAELEVPYILMHWRGHSDVMNSLTNYDDVLHDVATEISRRIDAAIAHRIDPHRIVLDPGLGFAKDAEHNWALLRGMETMKLLGRPLLIGASRKRFLGELLAEPDGTPRAVFARDAATDAITAISAFLGAWAVRVHDVRASADAVRVAAAWRGTADA